MNMMMNHQEINEQLEAYAFGTTEGSETDAVDRHLEGGCESCIDRLRQLVELSARLAAAVPQRDPSPAVKERLLEKIRSGRQRQSRAPASRSHRFGWVLAAAASAAAIVLAVWSLGIREDLTALRSDLGASQQEVVRLREDMATYETATRLLGKPCTRLVDLAGVEPNPQAFGKVMLHPDERVGIIYVYRLPQTPEGMEYQLWFLRDGKPASVGVFSVSEDGSAVLKLPGLPDPKTIVEFQVTIEPLGGRTAPTGMQYLQGRNTLRPFD